MATANGIKYGYTLAAEEHPAPALVEQAARAEAAGFDFVSLSDHIAPWAEVQGQSSFSWSVLGGISQRTERIEVLLGVVCPIMRYHPAIVAQAAATTASLLEGRFTLGVGTGEYLNEHIVGEGWPHISVRLEMLEEAVDIIRKLWSGRQLSYGGSYFVVEECKIYSLPRTPPPIAVSAFGPKAAKLAGKIGDGFVSLIPKQELIQTFEQAGSSGKPKYAQIHACYDTDESRARQTAFKHWPNAGVSGQASSELRLPAYFEQAAQPVDAATATKNMALGPAVDSYVASVRQFIDAGYTHIYFHHIGPNQDAFFNFWQTKLAPALPR
jgi:G6PDH family F420-dependent oxidoreductase